MLLSIITINYNNANSLEDTIKSISNQTSKDFEYLIIDGGSNDESLNVIQSQIGLINYWISEKDTGIYDAMNKGIIKASGKYLMFLNSGDCFSDNTIVEICNEQIKSFPETDIFYGDILGFNNSSIKPWLHKHPNILDLMFLKEQNINHQSSLIKSSLFKEFGLYPEQYKLAGDHWLYLKSYVMGKVFKHIDYPLVIFDYNGSSTLNRNLYENEMQIIWQTLVPTYLQKLIINQNEHQLKMGKKLFKVASWLDHKFQLIKRHSSNN